MPVLFLLFSIYHSAFQSVRYTQLRASTRFSLQTSELLLGHKCCCMGNKKMHPKCTHNIAADSSWIFTSSLGTVLLRARLFHLPHDERCFAHLYFAVDRNEFNIALHLHWVIHRQRNLLPKIHGFLQLFAIMTCWAWLPTASRLYALWAAWSAGAEGCLWLVNIQRLIHILKDIVEPKSIRHVVFLVLSP